MINLKRSSGHVAMPFERNSVLNTSQPMPRAPWEAELTPPSRGVQRALDSQRRVREEIAGEYSTLDRVKVRYKKSRTQHIELTADTFPSVAGAQAAW